MNLDFEVIAQLMEKTGTTQAEAARIIDVSRVTIGNWIRKDTFPNIDQWNKLERYLADKQKFQNKHGQQ